MTTTFGGVELPNAGKAILSFNSLIRKTLLLNGKRSIQISPELDTNIVVEGIATYTQILAVLAKAGSKNALVTNEGTFTNCVISGDISIRESDAPGKFNYRIAFERHTA